MRVAMIDKLARVSREIADRELGVALVVAVFVAHRERAAQTQRIHREVAVVHVRRAARHAVAAVFCKNAQIEFCQMALRGSFGTIRAERETVTAHAPADHLHETVGEVYRLILVAHEHEARVVDVQAARDARHVLEAHRLLNAMRVLVRRIASARINVPDHKLRVAEPRLFCVLVDQRFTRKDRIGRPAFGLRGHNLVGHIHRKGIEPRRLAVEGHFQTAAVIGFELREHVARDIKRKHAIRKGHRAGVERNALRDRILDAAHASCHRNACHIHRVLRGLGIDVDRTVHFNVGEDLIETGLQRAARERDGAFRSVKRNRADRQFGPLTDVHRRVRSQKIEVNRHAVADMAAQLITISLAEGIERNGTLRPNELGVRHFILGRLKGRAGFALRERQVRARELVHVHVLAVRELASRIQGERSARDRAGVVQSAVHTQRRSRLIENRAACGNRHATTRKRLSRLVEHRVARTRKNKIMVFVDGINRHGAPVVLAVVRALGVDFARLDNRLRTLIGAIHGEERTLHARDGFAVENQLLGLRCAQIDQKTVDFQRAVHKQLVLVLDLTVLTNEGLVVEIDRAGVGERAEHRRRVGHRHFTFIGEGPVAAHRERARLHHARSRVVDRPRHVHVTGRKGAAVEYAPHHVRIAHRERARVRERALCAGSAQRQRAAERQIACVRQMLKRARPRDLGSRLAALNGERARLHADRIKRCRAHIPERYALLIGKRTDTDITARDGQGTCTRHGTDVETRIRRDRTRIGHFTRPINTRQVLKRTRRIDRERIVVHKACSGHIALETRSSLAVSSQSDRQIARIGGGHAVRQGFKACERRISRKPRERQIERAVVGEDRRVAQHKALGSRAARDIGRHHAVGRIVKALGTLHVKDQRISGIGRERERHVLFVRDVEGLHIRRRELPVVHEADHITVAVVQGRHSEVLLVVERTDTYPNLAITAVRRDVERHITQVLKHAVDGNRTVDGFNAALRFARQVDHAAVREGRLIADIEALHELPGLALGQVLEMNIDRALIDAGTTTRRRQAVRRGRLQQRIFVDVVVGEMTAFGVRESRAANHKNGLIITFGRLRIDRDAAAVGKGRTILKLDGIRAKASNVERHVARVHTVAIAQVQADRTGIRRLGRIKTVIGRKRDARRTVVAETAARGLGAIKHNAL